MKSVLPYMEPKKVSVLCELLCNIRRQVNFQKLRSLEAQKPSHPNVTI